MTKTERELVEFARTALHGLDQSHMFVGLIDDRKLDPKNPSVSRFLLQLGYALVTGKLIILPVPHGVEVPRKLEAVADAIVRYNPDDMATLQAGLTKALTELGASKQ